MKIDIHDMDIKKVGSVDLPDAIFGVEVKTALLWEQVRAQRASRRRGTHATKNRAQVSGTGAKPFRQKGTGNARQGSRRAPQFVGGGVSMGPRPRSYAYRLPKTARRAALKSALSARLQEENLLVVDKFDCFDGAPKTKEIAAFLNRLGTKSALIVDVVSDDKGSDNLRLSIRNLPKSKYLAAEGLNVYDILGHEKLVLTQAALEPIIKKAQDIRESHRESHGEADSAQGAA